MPFNFYTSAGQQKTYDYANALAALGAMVPLYDVTLGAAAANIDIQNISQIYSHLKLILIGRTDNAVSDQFCNLRFNNDSGTNYEYQYAGATGTTNTSGAAGTQTSIVGGAGRTTGASAAASRFGASEAVIPNYTATDKYKTVNTYTQTSTSSSAAWSLTTGGVWLSTSAINRITIVPAAGNLIAGTRVTLYGLGVVAPPPPGSMLPVTYGTSLPASPVDGQEAILVDSTTNPSYQWRFRYNANSTSSYKWEFIGGPDAYTSGNITIGINPTYTNGTSFVLPRAGDYLIHAEMTASTQGCSYWLAIDTANNGSGNIWSYVYYQSEAGGGGFLMPLTIKTTGRSAGTIYFNGSNNSGSTQGGGMYAWIKPVRVS